MDKMQRQDKDVVIIGNGPSGICLSYLLAGNWPHYTGVAHPGDEMLTARLRYSVATQTNANDNSTACPTCQTNGHSGNNKANNDENRCFGKFSKREDLEFLTAGLEGRNGGKPLSLLMDQLQHPCLDAGMDEKSLLDWRSPEEHAEHSVTDHVVLGKGPPGGAWHALDPNVLTISLNRWMSLPGLDLRHWAQSLDSEERKRKLYCYSNDTDIVSNYNTARVPIGTVAAYYKDYVERQKLDKYFRCGTVVTSVKSIPSAISSEYSWLVEGYESETARTFEYRCKRVVLATGTTDSTNRLGISGEDTYNWVSHEFKDFERKLDKLNSPLRTISDNYDSDEIKSSSVEPVLIVGSGLSAADAIMAARSHGVPVIHVFRNSSKDTNGERKRSLDRLQWLPASIYPEYHQVYEMMADKARNYPLYKSLADHVVVDFSIGADKFTRTKTRKVTLCTPQGRLVSYRLSFAAVLIGSKPDLSFLQKSDLGLGKLPEKPIDSRSNQIDVDPFTYEIEKAPRKGLYAVGPLAGDNFVRFILGGAFGVLASIINTDKQSELLSCA